jgi:2'-5' RNA ligase
MPRRNVTKLRFRPPLPRRAIVWIPSLPPPTAARIARFRGTHDPLAQKIDAHVSLVFPFHANLSVAQIASHIKRITFGWPVLPVTFRGVDSVQDRFALLMCDLRAAALTELHDRLYTGPLAGFLRDDIVYRPHITLGRAETDAAFLPMLADAELLFRDTYAATCSALSIVRHNDDGTIVIEEAVGLSRT